METHPVPQNISSYQFRLVGDMTLKQFFQVAGGVLVGLLFYSTGLPGVIKWFFIIFSGLLGVALAFLPFEDRPLEKWILSFLRSIYSPTIFNWQKPAIPPVFFQDAATPLPADSKKMDIYLSTHPDSSVPSDLDKKEASMLSRIAQIFQPLINQPSIKAPIAPAGKMIMPSVPTPNVQPVRGVSIPQTNFISVAPPKKEVAAEISAPTTASPMPAAPTLADLIERNPVLTPPPPVNTPVEYSPEAAPPNPPTVANTVTGQTLDITGKIIEGAIMEIRDSAGRPVRALKTNKLGHFMVVTPLINGKYDIVTDKDGFTFEPAVFEASGNIVPPILIKGKAIEAV